MGNNPSKDTGIAPSSPAAAAAASSTSQSHRRRNVPVRRESSSQYSSSANPTSAPQSLEHTYSNSSSLASPTNPTPKPYPPLQHHPSTYSDESPPGHGSHGSRREETMGNAQSTQSAKEKQEIRRRERDHVHQSHPVRVPGSSHEKRQKGPDSQFEPSGPPRDPNYIPVSNLNFPPRLPLPIQEEVYTPGSPIITPADLSSALNEDEVQGTLPRPASLLSHTTVDDDEIDDELAGYGLEGSRGGTVPTLVEWKQGGNRVYITGTFASWDRKYRMHRE